MLETPTPDAGSPKAASEILRSPALERGQERGPEHGLPEAIEQTWRQVIADWDNPQAHRAFLTLCAAHHALPEAGKRYRRLRDQDPARAADAQRHIDNVLAMAMQSLDGTRIPASTHRTRARLTLASGLLMLLMLVTSIVLWMQQR